MQILKGVFFALANGNGYVKLEEGGELFIFAENRNGALHKDIVEARILYETYDKTVGQIQKVTERGLNIIVGTCEKEGKHIVCKPDDKKIAECIYLEESDKKYPIDHKIGVRITKSVSGTRFPTGAMVMDIGHKNAPGADILSIVYQMEIPSVFSNKTAAAAKKLPDKVNAADFPGRVDLTKKITVTIDGADTKDIDDAVIIEKSGEGYILTVAIADVAHYVKEGSTIDEEAKLRGTSVYLADRVIPMLPEELSNGICSLNEGELRLALCCEMHVNGSGAVTEHKIFEALLNVDKKMSYEKASEYLDNGEIPDGYSPFTAQLEDMRELCYILQKKRKDRGSIEFEFPECKITLDENGKTIDITTRERNIATQIIEEFMILCNETVAEEYFWAGLPFVYRCHDEPDDYRRDKFLEFLRNLGFSLKKNDSRAYQKLLDKVKGTPNEAMIGAVMLRSLQQAQYQPNNIGHFGLASKCYCHFTSPIRRYPDLQIHRIIKENITAGLAPERIVHYNSILPEVCSNSSATERRAQNCEREVENMKKIEYMSDKVGQSFDGVITGVTNFGLFVALPSTVEGLIPISTMDDYYRFDEGKQELTGKRTDKTYKLGQSVRVRVTRADASDKKLDFKLV